MKFKYGDIVRINNEKDLLGFIMPDEYRVLIVDLKDEIAHISLIDDYDLAIIYDNIINSYTNGYTKGYLDGLNKGWVIEQDKEYIKELPRSKYKIGQEVWFLSSRNSIKHEIINDIDEPAIEKYFVNGERWFTEEELYSSKEELIKAQIE